MSAGGSGFDPVWAPSDPNAFVVRYGLRQLVTPLAFLVGITAFLVVALRDSGTNRGGLLFFGAIFLAFPGWLVWRAVNRMQRGAVALGVDGYGVYLGEDDDSTPPELVPWADIEAVVYYRSWSSSSRGGRTAHNHVGVIVKGNDRAGEPGVLADWTDAALRLRSRRIQGWQLGIPRLTAAVQRYAPQVPVHHAPDMGASIGLLTMAGRMRGFRWPPRGGVRYPGYGPPDDANRYGPADAYPQPGTTDAHPQPGPPDAYPQPGTTDPDRQPGRPASYQPPGTTEPYRQPGQQNPYRLPGATDPYRQPDPQNPYRLPGATDPYRQPGPPDPGRQPDRPDPDQEPGPAVPYRPPGATDPYRHPGGTDPAGTADPTAADPPAAADWYARPTAANPSGPYPMYPTYPGPPGPAARRPMLRITGLGCLGTVGVAIIWLLFAVLPLGFIDDLAGQATASKWSLFTGQPTQISVPPGTGLSVQIEPDTYDRRLGVPALDPVSLHCSTRDGDADPVQLPPQDIFAVPRGSTGKIRLYDLVTSSGRFEITCTWTGGFGGPDLVRADRGWLGIVVLAARIAWFALITFLLVRLFRRIMRAGRRRREPASGT